jgi:putative addiction module component (TIGR02574 family)
MSAAAERILVDALSLPEQERAELVKQLVDSLVANAERARIDALWAAEVEARIDALERGEMETIPYEQVLAEIRRGELE